MGEFPIDSVYWDPPIFALYGLSHPEITDKSIACSLHRLWAGTGLWISRPTLIKSEMLWGCLDVNCFFSHAHKEGVHLCLSLTPSIYLSPVSWSWSLLFSLFYRVTIRCLMKLKSHTPKNSSEGGEMTGGRWSILMVCFFQSSLLHCTSPHTVSWSVFAQYCCLAAASIGLIKKPLFEQ